MFKDQTNPKLCLFIEFIFLSCKIINNQAMCWYRGNFCVCNEFCIKGDTKTGDHTSIYHSYHFDKNIFLSCTRFWSNSSIDQWMKYGNYFDCTLIVCLLEYKYCKISYIFRKQPPRSINEISVWQGYLPGKCVSVWSIGVSWKIVCVRGLDRAS